MGNRILGPAQWAMAISGFGFLPVILIIWSLFITGFALWHAARRGEKWWFIFFLIVHTLGIVELLYLVFVVKAFSAPQKSPRVKSKKRS